MSRCHSPVTHTHAQTCVCVCVHACMCAHLCVCVCVCVCVHACVHMCMALTAYVAPPPRRAAGGLPVGREPESRVLRRAVGHDSGGQPLPRHPEKNSPAVPAPDVPQLLGSLQTLQQPAQTLPAGPRAPTHCCQPDCVSQCNGAGPPRHLASGGESCQRGLTELPGAGG